MRNSALANQSSRWNQADYRALVVADINIFYGSRQIESYLICGAAAQGKKIQCELAISLTEAIEWLDRGLDPTMLVIWCESAGCVLEWASLAVSLASRTTMPDLYLIGPAAKAQQKQLQEHLRSFKDGQALREELAEDPLAVQTWFRSAADVVPVRLVA